MICYRCTQYTVTGCAIGVSRFPDGCNLLNKYSEAGTDWDETRIDTIGQNGPTGEHYEEV